MQSIYTFPGYVSMPQSYKRAFVILAAVFFWALLPPCNCYSQSLTDTAKAIDLEPKIAPEGLHFAVNLIEKSSDGSRMELDSVTGYTKYYNRNGQLQMEGKVTKTPEKTYRDGIWNYYSEEGLLTKQVISNNEGKIKELEFMYFKNRKPMSETLQYFEGDYKDKASFKLIKIELIFYTNGQKLSERHLVNGKAVYLTCWDSKGNQKPIEYLKTVKSFHVDE